MAYYLLTAKHVFEGNTVVEVCGKHLTAPVVPPSERVGQPIPACLERLVLECLCEDPAGRPPTAQALQQRLSELTDVGSWTHAQAADWWQAHDAELRVRRADEPVAAGRHVLTVDLDQRT